MCGRYTPAKVQRLEARFRAEFSQPRLAPRFNVSPTQQVAVILDEEPGAIAAVRWGLVPSWAKDTKIGASLINARAETVATKPSFRTAFRRRRCLVLADGFYEWQRHEGCTKTPFYMKVNGGEPFAFAGLWEE
jgi:putative SOS response-associated peptidase YedK